MSFTQDDVRAEASWWFQQTKADGIRDDCKERLGIARVDSISKPHQGLNLTQEVGALYDDAGCVAVHPVNEVCKWYVDGLVAGNLNVHALRIGADDCPIVWVDAGEIRTLRRFLRKVL